MIGVSVQAECVCNEGSFYASAACAMQFNCERHSLRRVIEDL